MCVEEDLLGRGSEDKNLVLLWSLLLWCHFSPISDHVSLSWVSFLCLDINETKNSIPQGMTRDLKINFLFAFLKLVISFFLSSLCLSSLLAPPPPSFSAFNLNHFSRLVLKRRLRCPSKWSDNQRHLATSFGQLSSNSPSRLLRASHKTIQITSQAAQTNQFR